MNKRMYRSRTEKVIAGISGGVGLYLDIDPTIVRLVFVALIFVTGGLMIPAYLLAWIIIPREPLAPLGSDISAAQSMQAESPKALNSSDAQETKKEERPKSAFVRILPGILLVLFGMIAFLNYQYWWDWSDLLPVALILLGLYFILRQWDSGKSNENSGANSGDPATAGAMGGSGYANGGTSHTRSQGGDE